MISVRQIVKASIFGVFILMAIVACAPTTTNPDSKPAEQIKATTLATAPAWQQEWDRLLVEARKEGKVEIWTTFTGEVRVALAEPFKQKYGLDLEFLTAKADEQLVKLERERKSNIFSPDVFLQGGTFQIRAKDNGYLEPVKPVLLLPEVNDTKAWFGGEHRYVDKEGIYSLAFSLYASLQIVGNKEMVKSDDVTSFKDLLNPKWKGRLTMSDPSIAGAPNYWFSWMVEKAVGLDYMRQLAKQEPVITRDSRLLWESVARGKYPLGIDGKSELYGQFSSAGAPIMAIWPSEGTYYSAAAGIVALANKAPHPNAAKVFINWLLTKEGQTVITKVSMKQSSRIDVPTDFLDQNSLRDPSKPYFILDQEEFLHKTVNYRTVAAEIFGPLLK